MTILFLLLITILAAVIFNRRGAALVLLVFLCVHLVLSGGGVITKVFLNELQSDAKVVIPAWKDKNAIVVLGFGTVAWREQNIVTSSSFAYARVYEALRLYQNCKTTVASECKIILSGGDPMRNGKAEADVMATELQWAGVSVQDLFVENESNNTFQNARNTAPMLKGYEQIYLVTTGIHMKRAMLFFKHFVPSIDPAPADKMQAFLSFIPISPNLIFFDFALHEYVGMLQYKIYNLMGWNPPKVSV